MANGEDLNEKQKKFCEEYAVDANGTQAAIRAGYSKNTATVQGAQLLRLLNVQCYIREMKLKQGERLKVTADDVLRSILMLAEHNITDTLGDDGKLLRLKDMPKKITNAIQSFEIDEDGYLTKVKFYDKMKANELLGKHFKLFTEQVEHKLEGSLASLVQASIDKQNKLPEPKDVTPITEGESKK